MIFLQILHTFRNLALAILPLFIIALIVAAASAEYYPPRVFGEMLKRNGSRSVLLSGLLGVVLPATSVSRIPMAALARQGGAKWPPVITFIAGASAGISTLILTSMIGFKVAVFRVIVALIYALFLAIIVERFLEPSLAAADVESNIEMLFSRDFSEVPLENIDRKGGNPEPKNIWFNLISLARIMLPWLFLSLLLASLISVAVPAATVQAILGGRFAAAKTALIGLPFYFVGGLEMPLVYVLLSKGVSFGAMISLMLAAPLVNVPVMSVMGRWLGYRKAAIFLAIFWLIASLIGTILNFIGVK